MKIELPDLPFPQDSLVPHISEKTIQFHYGKHHKAYVDNAIKLIMGTGLEEKSVEEIIVISSNNEEMIPIFNNAAQVWNHSFYWKSIKPGGGGTPTGPIKDKIDGKFGSYENFVAQFKNTAMSQFGSGWAWLVLKDDKLDITKTSNAATPMTSGEKPLFTVDVWEHAYYLDYQNRRADYIDVFFEHLINWDFVNSQI